MIHTIGIILLLFGGLLLAISPRPRERNKYGIDLKIHQLKALLEARQWEKWEK